MHGDDKDNAPRHIPNYFYQLNTGYDNLRRHLRNEHRDAYFQADLEYGWGYFGSDNEAAVKNPRSVDIPRYSSEVFMDHLVRFIAADDQVSLNKFISSSRVSHIGSRFASSSAPSFESYVWSSGRTLLSLAEIR